MIMDLLDYASIIEEYALGHFLILKPIIPQSQSHKHTCSVIGGQAYFPTLQIIQTYWGL